MENHFAIKKNINWITVFFCFLFTFLFISASAQTVILTPTDDAMVYQGSITNNYGTNPKLQVKNSYGSSINRNAYLKFNLTGITVAQAAKVTLRLYCNNKAIDTVQSVMGAFATGSGWTEGAITWKNAPALDSILSSTVAVSKSAYYEWDVTDYIKKALAAGTSTSFAIADLNLSNNLVEFSSKEATNMPQLVISSIANPVITAYYLDSKDGNDNNDGISSVTAWKTLNKINTTHLSPGAEIYFKSGQSFTGLFNISNSGTSANPVICDIYGGTAPAVIEGQGQPQAVFACNRPYVELKNLIVTNFRAGNISSTDLFSGILFMNEEGGTLNHIYLNNVKIDSVNSSDDVSNANTVYNGGLQFNVDGSRVPSNWNDVVIQNCSFTNLSRTGFNFQSDWDQRNVNTTFGQDLGDGTLDNWYPSTSIIIQNNIFKNIAGNGLIVRVAKNALVQGNLFDSCGTSISGNATFTFDTDSTIYQFNETKNTIYSAGETDARGIDADFRTKSTIIQYNYAHNNGLGGIVATGGNQTSGTIPQRFNVGTVIRYNLIENNDLQGVYFSGAIDGLDMYNNTLYADATHSNVQIVKTNVWAVAPINLRFKNNIFYFLGSNASYSFVSGSTYDFENNLYYGIHPGTEPSDPNKITGDPQFNNPGAEDGYKYLAGSAALNSGMLIPDNGGRDYYNNPVSSTSVPNVGMYNGPAVMPLPVTLVSFIAKKELTKVHLSWVTSTERNTSRFDLERSEDGYYFRKIGSVSANGNSSILVNYSFDDLTPVNGLNYYRLKQIDKDGNFIYSDVRIVNYGSTANGLNVYPNPAYYQILLNVNSDINTPVFITIFDIQGKKVKDLHLSSGLNVEINVSDLKRGIYLIDVNNFNTNQPIGNTRFLKL